MPLQWSPSLAMGVPEIDRQHQELFSQVNELLSAMASGQGRERLLPLLEFLGRYATQHFRTEERYMSQYSYPAAAAHKQQHEAFVQAFGHLAAEAKAQGASTDLTLKVQRQVVDWLQSHVAGTDRSLGAYLRAKMG